MAIMISSDNSTAGARKFVAEQRKKVEETDKLIQDVVKRALSLLRIPGWVPIYAGDFKYESATVARVSLPFDRAEFSAFIDGETDISLCLALLEKGRRELLEKGVQVTFDIIEPTGKRLTLSN
ncbi:MAG: hypothetical protein M1150_03475 [Patescibacteria group bacterium]|nr:hypothetical protein [Patescibacteria group bacterium]